MYNMIVLKVSARDEMVTKIISYGEKKIISLVRANLFFLCGKRHYLLLILSILLVKTTKDRVVFEFRNHDSVYI